MLTCTVILRCRSTATTKFLAMYVAGLYAADGCMALASAKDGAGGQVSIAVLHNWARCSTTIAADVQHARSAALSLMIA